MDPQHTLLPMKSHVLARTMAPVIWEGLVIRAENYVNLETIFACPSDVRCFNIQNASVDA
jgi:hypothetical protein